MNGTWQEVTIALNGSTSSEINLGAEFRHVQCYNPALDSATITIKPGRNRGDTAVQAYTFDADATGDYVNTTTARATAGMNVFKDICAKYVTVVLGANQTSLARTLWIRGIGRM
jgi:hypothetical protein